MYPLGASGLALAGSIGGWVLFGFTVKEVGTDKFLTIVRSKKSLYFIAVIVIFSLLLYYVNIWLISHIR